MSAHLYNKSKMGQEHQDNTETKWHKKRGLSGTESDPGGFANHS